MPANHQEIRTRLHALWQCADDGQRAEAMKHLVDRLTAALFNDHGQTIPPAELLAEIEQKLSTPARA